MFPYDYEILTAVSAPPASIDGVVRAMQEIDALCADADGLKWFNRLYLDVTLAVQERCGAGNFGDPTWMAALDVEFAALYFAAVRSTLSGGRAPACWRALFDRRAAAAVARIQFALAGVNAHINHDLALAIGSACKAAGLAPSHGLEQYADFTALNITLESMVATAKRELAVRLLGDALPAFSHVEDTLAAFSVSAAREAAWNNAEMLWALGPTPGLRDRALATLDGLTALAGKTLLVPA